MATVIAHFYNEEYLLPWWLKQHKEIFDHGVLIDYNSTDRSVEIIKEICPTWEIIKSRNPEFGAEGVDQEVMDIENGIPGYKIALNITEFLINKSDKSIDEILDHSSPNCYRVLRANIADDNPEEEVTYDDVLVEKKNFGIVGDIGLHTAYRYIHNFSNGKYCIGRHIVELPINQSELPFIIFWYGFAPWNEHLIKRKTQIKSRMTKSNIAMGMGHQHLWDVQQMEIFKNGILANGEKISIK